MLDLLLPTGTSWPRPPGAVDEALFLERCTKCDRCIIACPHDAIGQLVDGTPAMNPATRACHLCDGLPCAAACEEGALAVVPLAGVFFGLAEVDASKCFASMGPECGSCVVSCPISAIKGGRGAPTVDADRCVGCGLCLEACPVWGKAITVQIAGPVG